MMKTTMRELRTFTQVEDLAELYGKDEFMRLWNNTRRRQIAYAAGIYGCNGRLFETDLWGLVAQTGRTMWMFCLS